MGFVPFEHCTVFPVEIEFPSSFDRLSADKFLGCTLIDLYSTVEYNFVTSLRVLQLNTLRSCVVCSLYELTQFKSRVAEETSVDLLLFFAQATAKCRMDNDKFNCRSWREFCFCHVTTTHGITSWPNIVRFLFGNLTDDKPLSDADRKVFSSHLSSADMLFEESTFSWC